MPIKIHKTTSENFPSKVAVCGNGIFDKQLITASWFRRTEWVYGKLRSGIAIHTAIANSEVIGQITALPLDESPVELQGERLWYIPCIWMASKHASPMLAHQLLESLINELESKTDGIVTLSDDIWMSHKSILESFGFIHSGNLARLKDRNNSIMLLKLDSDCTLPEKIPNNAPSDNDERLHFFYSSHCPAHVLINYRISRENCISGCKVRLVKHDCGDREKVRRYGVSLGLYYKGDEILKRYLYGPSLTDLIEEMG